MGIHQLVLQLLTIISSLTKGLVLVSHSQTTVYKGKKWSGYARLKIGSHQLAWQFEYKCLDGGHVFGSNSL